MAEIPEIDTTINNDRTYYPAENYVVI